MGRGPPAAWLIFWILIMFILSGCQLIIGLALATCTTARIVVAELVEVGSSSQIIVSTRFKSSEVALSSKTRELARRDADFADMSQIPSIEVKYEGTTPRKWRHLRGDTSIYLFKTSVDESELPALLAARSISQTGRMVLLHGKY